MLRFINRNIAVRLGGGFTIMLLLVILTGTIGTIGAVTIRRVLDEQLETSFIIDEKMLEIQVALGNAQRLEALFRANIDALGIETSETIYGNRIPQRLDSASAALFTLSTLPEVKANEDLSGAISEMNDVMIRYDQSVETLITSFNIRGVTDTGMIGELVDHATVMQAVADESENPEILTLFGEMLGDQSRYLAFSDSDARHQASAIARRLGRLMEAEVPDLYAANDMESRVADYVALLSDLYRLDSDINIAIQSIQADTIRLNALLEQFREDSLIIKDTAEGEIFEQIQVVLWSSGVVVLIAIAVGAILSIAASASITRPVRRLREVSHEVADGDLSRRVDVRGHDELADLGHTFNRMADTLSGVVTQEVSARELLETTLAGYVDFVQRVGEGDLTHQLELSADVMLQSDLRILGENLNKMVARLAAMSQELQRAAYGISEVATEMLAAATEQAATATEQAASVTQTMAAVEQLRTVMTHAGTQAEGLVATAQESRQVSDEGFSAVSDSVNGMQEVRSRVEDIAHAILTLSEHTQQIGEINETVDGIAEQSKLLALNASIEAARAGEEGRGFAVVASEIRLLAERSRQATGRVAEILQEIQQTTNTVVMVTEEGSKGADVGLELVSVAGDTLGSLTETVARASTTATQIAGVTNQQLQGIEHLVTAMQNIRHGSAESSSSSQQIQHNAEDLNDMARQMHELAAQYQIDEQGNDASKN